MKIAYFIAEYQRAAGSQRSLLNLIKKLTPEVDSVVIFPMHGGCTDYYIEAGIKSIILHAPEELNIFEKKILNMNIYKKAFLFLFRLLPYSFSVYKYLRNNRINIMHCNTGRAVLLAAIIPKLMGIKIVLHVRGREANTNYLNKISHLIADRIIVVAYNLKKEFNPKLHKKISVVYNSIDEYDVKQIHKSTDKNISKKKYVSFLVLASIVPFKAYHHIIEAVNLLIQQFKNFHVIAAGDIVNKDYYNYICSKINRYQINKYFRFLGWIENPYQLFIEADVIVMPSIEKELLFLNDKKIIVEGNEGFPRVILEAMFFSKPVIASNIAGVPEQVAHNITGIIVPPADPKSLADAMFELATNEEKRKIMGQQGNKRFTILFHPNKMRKEVLKIYSELIEN